MDPVYYIEILGRIGSRVSTSPSTPLYQYDKDTIVKVLSINIKRKSYRYIMCMGSFLIILTYIFSVYENYLLNCIILNSSVSILCIPI